MSEDRTGKSNADLLKIYDEWIEDSNTLDGISEDMRENVSRKARDFVRMGQEEVLSAE